MNGLRRIAQLASSLSLTKSVIDRANDIYKRVEESKELKGRRTEAVLVACLIFACRDANVPRTIKELCEIADVRKRDVSRAFSRIKKAKLHKTIKTFASISDLMVRFCSNLKLSPTIEKVAVEVATKAKPLFGSTNPASIAGAAIAMVTALAPDPKLRRSLADIASVTLMSASTIKNCYSTMYPKRMELVPTSFVSPEVVKSLAASPDVATA